MRGESYVDDNFKSLLFALLVGTKPTQKNASESSILIRNFRGEHLKLQNNEVDDI